MIEELQFEPDELLIVAELAYFTLNCVKREDVLRYLDIDEEELNRIMLLLKDKLE